MTERKPISETWESYVERKIREAQTEGAFDSLAGFGRPIADIDAPEDPNWWAKQKLREERLSLLPPILEARLEAEKTLETVWSLPSEHDVRRRLAALNDRIRKAHFSAIDGPADGVRPVDIEAIVEEWRRRDNSRRS